MRRNAKVVPAAAVGLAVLAAIVAIAWGAGLGSRTFYTDGGAIRTSAADVRPRKILWLPPSAHADAINTEAEEYESRISADGQQLFFVRGRAGENADIFVCSRQRNGWSEPVSVEGINTEADELGPEPLPDGSGLIFYSDREGGIGGYDLWLAKRAGDAWEAPVNLGDAVNSLFNEYNPATTPDGSRLYFASNRPRPGETAEQSAPIWPATIRETQPGHDYDLFTAAMEDGVALAAQRLDALNTEHNEGTPAVSPIGDFLYFSSDRPGGAGGLDLYRARVLAGAVQAPEPVGEGLNTPYNELDPSLSLAGFGMEFSSNRPAGAEDAAGDYNLFHSESREVFPISEPRRIDWAGLWSTILPWLLWILLALALLALLWLLRETLRNKRLSTLAKCLIGSGIVHLIILFLLSLWGVSNSIGEFLRKPGGSKVHLVASDSSSDSLVSQVRGELTQIEIAPPAPEVQFQVALPARTPTLEARPEVQRSDEAPSAIVDAATLRSTSEAPRLPQSEPTEVAAQQPQVREPDTAPPVAAAEQQVAMEDPRATPQVAMQSPQTSPQLSASSKAAATLSVPQTSVMQPAPMRSADAPASGMSVAAAEPAQAMSVEPAAPAAPQAAATEERSERAPEPSAFDRPGESRVPTQGLELTASPSAPGAASLPEAAAIELSAPRHSQVALDAPSVEATEPSSPATDLALRTPSEVAPKFADAEREATGPSVNAAPQIHTAPTVQTQLSATASKTAPSQAFQPEPTLQVQTRISDAPRAQVPPPSAVPEPPVDLSLAPIKVPNEALRTPAQPEHVPPGVPTPSVAAIEPSRRDVAPSTPPVLQAREGKVEVSASDPERALDIRPTPTRTSTESPSSSLALDIPDLPALPTTDLKLPAETAPAEAVYSQRAPEVREEILEKHGGDEETEAAVRLALGWLSRHQHKDGHWDSHDFDENCNNCEGASSVDSDMAVTGLALLCFFGADHTHQREGEYQDVARRAVAWILSRQSEDGDLRAGESMYTHGIATIALAEAFGMTKDPALREPVQKAVDFIVRAKSNRGGWRYDPGQPGDTSVLGWQVMAMVSAKRAGLNVPDSAIAAAHEWLDSVSRGREGIYSYQRSSAPTASMTAEGLFCRQLLGDSRDLPRAAASVNFLRESPPKWGRRSTTYYWYYGTLALFQHGGEDWDRWNAAVKKELLGHQEKNGEAAGSWEPLDRWSLVGGRVYQTAICTLTLEVYYRYLPLYRRDEVAGR